MTEGSGGDRDTGTAASAVCAPCPLCGTVIDQNSGKPKTPGGIVYPCSEILVFHLCHKCDIAFRTIPMDIEDQYDEHYSDAIALGFRSEGKDRHASRTLRRIEMYMPRGGSVLDVGCADGAFLSVVRKHGWKGSGVEKQEKSALAARARGLTVYGPSIGDLPNGVHFDVITLLDVIEHVRDPRPFLKRLSEVLSSGGILYLETPNLDSVYRRMCGRNWMGFILHHEILYSARALTRVLVESGFHVRAVYSDGFSPLSYGGLRRMRLHHLAFNLLAAYHAVLVRVGVRKVGTPVLTSPSLITRLLNTPLDALVNLFLRRGDQLIVIASASIGTSGAGGRSGKQCPKRHIAFSSAPRVSVVIPSSDGDRNGNVPLLLQDLKRQSFKEMEVTVVIGVSPQGKAINQGVTGSKGEILVILDDDSRLSSVDTIASLVRVIDADPKIGMAGASIVQPEDANRLQRMAAREFPRLAMDVVDEVTDSDMPCHGCCAFPRQVFDEVGGERENIVRGLDPDLRHRLRRKGYRVVLVPRMTVSHPLPATMRGFIRMFYRNGRGSAYIQRHHPGLIYDTAETTQWRGDDLRVGWLARVARYPVRTIGHLLHGRVFRFLGDFAYLAGYISGLLEGKTA